jgi:hypothetical protein
MQTPVTNTQTFVTNMQTPVTNTQTLVTNMQTPVTNPQTLVTNTQTLVTNTQTLATNMQTPVTNMQTLVTNTQTLVTNMNTNAAWRSFIKHILIAYLLGVSLTTNFSGKEKGYVKADAHSPPGPPHLFKYSHFLTLNIYAVLGVSDAASCHRD